MNDESDISKWAVPLHKKIRNIFVPNVTVWLVRIWEYENADEKEHIFSWKRKNVQKRTKNGYCVNPLLIFFKFKLIKINGLSYFTYEQRLCFAELPQNSIDSWY